jgi:ElaB/YqjD/DUF883 family membrane-anchored ribosome-binding protein
MTTNNAQTPKQPTRARTSKDKDDAIQAELDELREQLESLKTNAEAEKKTTAKKKSSTDSSANDNPESLDKDSIQDVIDDIPSHFRDLIENLDESLKDESTTKLLAVFAAGILVGRLLPR